MPADAELARVRELCRALPAVTEAPTHGAPTWFVNGRRSFAKFVDPARHRAEETGPEETGPALRAAAPPGVRHELTAADPVLRRMPGGPGDANGPHTRGGVRATRNGLLRQRPC